MNRSGIGVYSKSDIRYRINNGLHALMTLTDGSPAMLQQKFQKYKLAANTTRQCHGYLAIWVGKGTTVTLTVPLNLDLSFLHFLKKICISNDTCSISNFTARLVETCDDSHNSTFCDIRQSCYLFEWLTRCQQHYISENMSTATSRYTHHSLSPLIHDLN